MGMRTRIVPMNFSEGINTKGDEFLRDGSDEVINGVFDKKGTLQKVTGYEPVETVDGAIDLSKKPNSIRTITNKDLSRPFKYSSIIPLNTNNYSIGEDDSSKQDWSKCGSVRNENVLVCVSKFALEKVIIADSNGNFISERNSFTVVGKEARVFNMGGVIGFGYNLDPTTHNIYSVDSNFNEILEISNAVVLDHSDNYLLIENLTSGNVELYDSNFNFVKTMGAGFAASAYIGGMYISNSGDFIGASSGNVEMIKLDNTAIVIYGVAVETFSVAQDGTDYYVSLFDGAIKAVGTDTMDIMKVDTVLNSAAAYDSFYGSHYFYSNAVVEDGIAKYYIKPTSRIVNLGGADVSYGTNTVVFPSTYDYRQYSQPLLLIGYDIANKSLKVLSKLTAYNSNISGYIAGQPVTINSDLSLCIPVYTDADTQDLRLYEIDNIFSKNQDIQSSDMIGYSALHESKNLFSLVGTGENIPIELTNSASSGGGLVSGQTYGYKAISKYINESGQIIRTAISPRLEITANATGTVDIATIIPEYLLGIISLEFYRTKGYTATGAPEADIFYLIGEQDSNLGVSKDDVADSNLDERPILYNSGNPSLEIAAPPRFKDTVIWQSRLVGLDAESNEKIHISRSIGGGYGVEFNIDGYVVFNESINGQYQKPQAIGAIDNKLVVFSEDNIFMTYGNIVSNDAIASQVAPFELISVDAGCIYPRSVISYRDGILFASKKGFFKINRAMQVEEMHEVEGFSSDFVKGSILIPSDNAIKFYTDNRVIKYNYEFGQWTTFDYSSDAVCLSSGEVYNLIDGVTVKDSSNYLRIASEYNMSYKTSWLRSEETQGYMRVRKLLFLARWKGSHKLRITFYYDYDESKSEVHEITKTGLSVDDVYQMRIHLRRQKCEAIKVKFEDLSDGTNILLNSAELSNMALEIGVKRGYNKLGKENKA